MSTENSTNVRVIQAGSSCVSGVVLDSRLNDSLQPLGFPPCARTRFFATEHFDSHRSVEFDFNRIETRGSLSERPDSLATAYCYWENWNASLDRHANRSWLKPLQFSVASASSAFWEDHYDSAIA
jgi:hypothetical protein